MIRLTWLPKREHQMKKLGNFFTDRFDSREICKLRSIYLSSSISRVKKLVAVYFFFFFTVTLRRVFARPIKQKIITLGSELRFRGSDKGSEPSAPCLELFAFLRHIFAIFIRRGSIRLSVTAQTS